MTAPATSLPTLSQVATMDTAYLSDAAAYWDQTATTWENVFTEIHRQAAAPAGGVWKGLAADSAHARTYGDMVQIRATSDQLLPAAAVAHRAEEQLRACREGVLEAVRDARADCFDVGDDYAVTDRVRGGSADLRAARSAEAQGHAAFIRHRVAALVAADQQIAQRISAAIGAIGNLTFHEPNVGVGDAKDPRFEAVDRSWKRDPPQPGPDSGPSADEIRKVLDGLPEGDKPSIREVRSPDDLEKLWNWMKRNGVGAPNRYRNPAKGEWVKLPDGTDIGRREAARSTDRPALDVHLPGPDGYIKVHVNPGRGGVPQLSVPTKPPSPVRLPVESAPVLRPPVAPVPQPEAPSPGSGGFIGGGPFPGLHLIHPPHTRHGQLIIGDPDEIFEENK
ncbi:hypothetical protein [Mycobacterium parmense]|uniref:Uncharacterized protein n=1 Tax=Mycobacterium parmense TaxID=185642 RepID=A0A7I7YQP5_9MYCO|nr:hypothetical protein [Mycobacterium parmense]MCV7349863.1 hypothetical protein [Mycobacterium parmense]BBZ43482.1 hypothetical protein MPRM_07630 [Mycobacterium parmense]